MKKSFSFLLVLVLVFSFTLPAFATETFRPKGNSRSVTLPKGGPYVRITQLEPGILNFSYGWNSLKYFDPVIPIRGYTIGVRGGQGAVYGKWFPNPSNPWSSADVPQKLELSWNIEDIASLDRQLSPGDECEILFGVIRGWGKDQYGYDVPYLQLMIIVPFTMP